MNMIAPQGNTQMTNEQVAKLQSLCKTYGLIPELGHIMIMGGKPYVTSAGLQHMANAKGIAGIHMEPVVELCDPKANVWFFKATVFKTKEDKQLGLGFEGYGDATPSNVSQMIVKGGAIMRMAQTRARNIAIRSAYSLGVASAEELAEFEDKAPQE